MRKTVGRVADRAAGAQRVAYDTHFNQRRYRHLLSMDECTDALEQELLRLRCGTGAANRAERLPTAHYVKVEFPNR
jgi:hypothetical protein